MHRHSRKSLAYGGKKGDDRKSIVLQQPVQGKCRVFPAAPAKYDPFAHGYPLALGGKQAAPSGLIKSCSTRDITSDGSTTSRRFLWS
jgi:hypothetical protein